MKKIVLTLLAALCCYAAALAVPAYPGFIRHTQPDGSTVMLRQNGDEFCHWLTNAYGQVVEKGEDGYYRPVPAAQLSSRRNAARVRRAAANAARRAPAKAGIATGQKRFLVILVEFSDTYFASSTANDDFTALLNQPGYSVNGGTGSARDFYYDNSHGAFEPVFDVYGPVRLSQSKAYYGGNDDAGNDLRAEMAVQQGCLGLDNEIDFTRYDNDKDGEVDLVFMYYAGYGEADSDDSDSIWPHQYGLAYAGIDLSLDGKTVNQYACTNELVGSGSLAGTMCGIGTACHEFGHAMGLPDFYDTDYEQHNGLCAGMFFFSTMDSGSYNNEGRTPPYFTIEERILLGWIDESCFLEFPNSGTYVIPSVDDNVAYKTPTDMDGEYFVYECRGANGWDAGLPSHGLIVTHVDKSSRKVSVWTGYSNSNVAASSLWSNWEQYNAINENGSHPCCYVVPASDQSNLLFGYVYYAEYEAYFFDSSKGREIPFPGYKGITTFTAKSWNGVDSAIRLSNIAYSNNQVTLHATVPTAELAYNVIENPGNGVYSAGSSFALNLVESGVQPVSSVAWYFDDEPVSGPSVTLTAGTHVVEAHLTLTSGETKVIDLTIEAQ